MLQPTILKEYTIMVTAGYQDIVLKKMIFVCHPSLPGLWCLWCHWCYFVFFCIKNS